MTSHSEKINKIVCLIDVSIPNSDNLLTAYIEKMRKYAELSIEKKQQSQIAAICTLPVTSISATEVFPHTLHDVLQHLDNQTFCM
jgi:hypothetical protein